jgi:hypothetical protein
VRDTFTRDTKSVVGGVTRIELGKLLENFKTYILGTISSQLDTLKIKKKQEEENTTLTIFCAQCRKRHPLRECPLNNVKFCAICVDNHDTKVSPHCWDFKLFIKEVMGQLSHLFKLHKRGLGNHEHKVCHKIPHHNFMHLIILILNNGMLRCPWHPWPQQPTQNQPWKQGWRGNAYGNMAPQQFPMPYPILSTIFLTYATTLPSNASTNESTSTNNSSTTTTITVTYKSKPS